MPSPPTTVVSRHIVLDLDRCTGCRASSPACHVGHHEQTNLVPGIVADVAILPVHCRHCEQPACAAACEERKFGTCLIARALGKIPGAVPEREAGEVG